METTLGAASWLLGQVLNKLSNDLVAGYVASRDLGLNYETIKRGLLHTQALLHEAQKREATDNPGLQGLLEDLGKKGDEADDALDELHYFIIQDKLDGTRDAAPDLGDGICSQALHASRAIRHNVGNCSQAPHARAVRQKVGNCLSSFTTFFRSQDDVVAATDYTHKSKPHNDDKLPQFEFDRVDMSKKIKQLIEDIHSLCEPINNLLLISLHRNPQQVRRPITSSATSKKNEFYGRDKFFEEIIGDLTGGTYCKTLSVLPIVGPGGVGKTTFAQHLFNDERIKDSFPVRIWVCVSNTFDVLKLTQEIYSCILAAENEDSNRANSTVSNLGLLHEKIEKRLKSKQFLIVFDDIWECKNKSEWDNLVAPFQKGETKGNMVLVTTRFPRIANMVKNEEISSINLQGLEPQGFWEFFKVCAFGEVNDEQDLIDIAKAISDKLKCSPLAAKTVGPLLRKNHSREHWIGILNKKEWENLKDSDDNIMPALKISYDYLPFRLKKCFSYCALFPEDHRFYISVLTRFWDAIGILHTSGQTESAEDLVDGLVDHGFLIKQGDGSSQYYVLHDLLHELSQKVSSQECVNISFTGFVAECIPPSVRHVSITVPSRRKCSKDIEQEMNKLKTRIDIGNLRTLLIFGDYKNKHANILKDTFNKIKDLRVLFIFIPSPETLPCNFSNLIHLRYLEIRTSSSVSLPSAISRFYHLKFFILKKSWVRKCIAPKDFNRLVNLRHVEASNEFHSSIPEVGKMGCLEVLKEFHVKKESDGFELVELGKLTKLEGSLRIVGLEKVKTKEEGEEALLKNKSKLSELSLEFSRTGQTTGHDAIEGLRPHPNLRGLEIEGHSGITGPSWLCRDICVTSLESLSLSDISWDVLPPFGRLPLLRSLQLSEIHELSQFRLDCGGVSDGSFKHLKEIKFKTMPDLVEWIGGDNSHLFSKLESIHFYDCPNLTTLPFSDCNGVCSEGRDIKWFPYLREFVIRKCLKLLPGLPPMPYTSTLTNVHVYGEGDDKIHGSDSKSLTVRGYSGALALDNIGSKIERMEIEDAPQILLTDLQKLSSLKNLDVSGDMFSEEVGADVVFPSVEKVTLRRLHPTGTLLSNVFKCLPALTEMVLTGSNGDHGELVLQFPPSSLLCSIYMERCDNLILSAEGGGAFRDLTSLQSLRIEDCGKIFSQWSQLAEARQVINTFPASVRELELIGVRDKLSMAVLSNLTSLTSLQLWRCDNLTVHGFNPLIGLGDLKELVIFKCGSVAADLLAEVAKDETLPAGSWQLESLVVDTKDISLVLVDPICRRLSATLRNLCFWGDGMMERFSQEQEKALQLLTALEDLELSFCTSLQSLPEALHRLCSLKTLKIWNCPKIQCLPTYGLPTSLEVLVAYDCSDELRIEVQGLEETRPDVEIHI